MGDVLKGSGFVVTHRPYTSVRAERNRLWVEGYYPNGAIARRAWNASTNLTVLRGGE